MTWLHPMIVHFAIGLLLAAAVFDVVGLARTNERLIFAGFWNVVTGAIAAVLTVVTGLYAESTLGSHNAIGNELLSVHKFFGLVVSALAVTLAAWRISMKGYILPRRRTLYLTGAFFSGFLIVATGALGGALVYIYGLGLPPAAAQRVLEAQPKVVEARKSEPIAPPSEPPRPDAGP